jgi:DNA replication protein DnaC
MDQYQSRVSEQVRAFDLHHSDRKSIAFIARQLGQPEGVVQSMIDREHKHRDRIGTAPRNRGDRGHTVTDAADKVCDFHGPYVSEYWKLNNPPELLPANMRGFWSQCPTCDRFMQQEVDRTTAEIMDQSVTRDEMRRAARREANIPERYHGAHLGNWVHSFDKQTQVWRWVMNYCSGFDIVLQTGRSCAFAGGTGTGKTRLASSMLAYVLDKGGTGFYTTAADLLGRIKDTYNDKATETERQVLEFFASRDLLVIDEVGKQVDSNYDQSQLFRLIDLRYRSLRPCVLVSNLTVEGLGTYLGTALMDRLRESGGGILGFDWASQRSRKTPETTKDKETDQ